MKNNKKKIAFLTLAGVVSVSTLSAYATAEYQQSKNEHMTNSVLWYQKSGEMKALYYQAYNLGKMMVDERLEQKDMKNKNKAPKLAIVLDIDETVLDNSPHSAYSIAENVDYPTGWSEWIASAQAEALPGALEFLDYVDSKGIEIFYVSNRTTEEKDATMKNLKEKGFPQVSVDNVVLKTTTSSKEARREAIAKDYEIVAFFGDNLGDFAKDFDKKPLAERNGNVDRLQDEFGKKFIVLPNPMYGDWEGAVYEYNFSKSPAEKDKARKDALNVFHP
ncbi:5'-nucleotidase, lipoprotein e(P4) family [Bacillus sp. M6-12]|uniref:5'-nucleotidase, lipoprotein e(P4) family n=1 Tax=Bacillus sp. M6-12 TaxID=2054166 RepID=UPI000C7933A7|nr:5'-nucleotidase, lipoprotein e(P4) family [Bacillus sp. M6-12]PLS19413.1 5'-nucleotidase, lipoprotein e(P4) family [Bacillus sp. M6-12]